MAEPTNESSFKHAWQAEILPARPLILPPRHFIYPRDAEEVERGALEIMVRPGLAPPFLATCALGFRDPAVPTGIWAAPRAAELCAVSGGYAYVIDTTDPARFTMIPYRPVLQVIAAAQSGLLLFVGHHSILAWGANERAWESPKLSDEGITIGAIEGNTLHGLGWNMMTDREAAFQLNLWDGQRMA